MLQQHLEKLADFVGVVEHGSIRSFATSKKLAQPGVSRNIQILESVLESQLLIRSQNGIKLTASGEILYKHAKSILDQTVRVENQILAFDKDYLKGRIVLGTYPSIAVYFIAEFMTFVYQRQKQFQLNIITDTSAKLIELLKKGTIDICISVEPPKTKGLKHTKLFSDKFSLYRSARSGKDLDNQPFFVVQAVHSGIYNLEKSCKNAGIQANKISYCDDFETVKTLLSSGIGSGILPDRVAKPLVESSSLVKVFDNKKLLAFGEHGIYLSVKSHRDNDPKINWISKQIESMLS